MSKAAELAALIGSGQAQGNRNIIINGAMQVAQRGTSAVAAGAGTYPSIDRFKAWESTDGAFTVEQSTTAPAGFTTSFKAQVTTADTSLAAAQYAQLSHQIEAQNLQHLEYGTSGAKTLTLSFHVRSSKTGSYSITLYKDDTTRYLFSKSYTIDSADTWEKKTITIAPDSNIKASGGAIANDNGIGFYVFWNLAAGTNFDDATDNAWSSNTSHFNTNSQVNWMDNTSNNFYLTGVQLEIGDVATPFEHEDIGTTLAKCQRYYTIEKAGTGGTYKRLSLGQCQDSTSAGFIMSLSTPLRGTPTLETSGNSNHYQTYSAGAVDTLTGILLTSDSDAGTYNHNIAFNVTVSSGLVAGDAASLVTNNNASYYLAFDAEL